jgi:hypothetical protein
MKLRTAIIFALAWIVLLTCGCHRELTKKVALPPDIAGTWKAREAAWKIVLSPDGIVSSAIADMGRAEIRPNETTKIEMKDGQFSTYKAGDCPVEYTPATRELFVSIELEDIHIVFLDNVIDGKSTDRFVGPVSQDGKEWTTEWIKIFDYGPRFPQEPNDIYAEPLVFDKIED